MRDDDARAYHVNEHEPPNDNSERLGSGDTGEPPPSPPGESSASGAQPGGASSEDETAQIEDTDAPTVESSAPPTVESVPRPAAASAAGGPAEPEAAARISKGRLIGVDALIVVTTILAVVGMLAVWANRLLFNPDNWSNTSTQLLENAEIRNAASNYIVDQLYANVNVAALLKSGLPPRLDPLAGPAAGALRNVAVQGTEFALQRPAVQSLWETANRVADESLIAVVDGKRGPVGTESGVVTLNLSAILDNVAARFGLPSGLSSKLPPNVATLTIFKSDQLSFVQKVGKAIKGLALVLTILVPLLYLLAILLARAHRRRTLMSVGFAIVIAGIVGIAGRAILKNAIVDSLVHNEAQRPAVRATVGIGTALLNEIAVAFILVGLVVVVAAWFAGPSRPASAARRSVAPFLRERPGATYGIVAVILLLVFIWQPIPATGTWIGILVFIALALVGTELLRRQTESEFPDAHHGDTMAVARGRVTAMRERREQRHVSHGNPGPEASLPAQLERLATLRDNGSITPEEYETAKAQLLKV
jgi:Short C-terminal domain